MARDLPVLIQGGMGVGVSDWRLARAVSSAGQLGVVSGTALDTVMARRLQLGDPGGDIRRALAAYPSAAAAERILDRFFVPGGKADDERFRQTSMNRAQPSRNVEELILAANFVEVYLAKEGHDGPVGINYLEKVQSPTLPSIYGAMLAGVDVVLMGAGIPKTIPTVLDRLTEGLPVELKLDVKGPGDQPFLSQFDPREAVPELDERPTRPAFLAIVSSHVLAVMLGRKIENPVDGFVVEAPTAGGHNAPPRGKMQLSESGEPTYGERDVPDLAAFRELGLPFWLAGGYSRPDQVREALAEGAAGIQVGTPFAYCEESGLAPALKQQVLDLSRRGEAEVFTDPLASPSGFPFKVVNVPGTLSDPDVYDSRTRECEVGLLRTAYRNDDGSLGWRCQSEPVEVFVRKGGEPADTAGRKCLCSSLLANIGLGQIQRDGSPEPALVTSGDSVAQVADFLPPEADSYSAADVIRRLLPSG